MVDTKARLERLSELLTREIRILEISSKIDTETQERVGKVTKEAILREKMKSIEKELGEDDDSREIGEFRKKIKAAQMPEDVKKTIMALGLIAISVGVFVASCAPALGLVFVECSTGGALKLLSILVAALVANQSVHRLAPETKAVKAVKAAPKG